MAAGLFADWSTIKLLIMRGCVSNVRPECCAYDVIGPAGPNSGGFDSACRKSGVVRRGNTGSAAPKVSRPGIRLLQLPSTVRRPYDVIGSGTWFGPGPTRAPHGPVAEVVFATCASE